MKQDLKLKKDKSILAYYRELSELNKVVREAPLIKLAEPYQNGWTKYFVLRDDYTRRSDVAVFRNILKVIGTEVFCRKMNFLDRKGKPYGPGLRIIGKNEWEMLGWTEQYKKHFVYGLHIEKNCWGNTSTREGYKIVRPFFFVENIKPHFVTHTRTHYPDVESRIAYINNKFAREQLWNRWNKINGYSKGSYDWRCAKALYLDALGTKEIENYDQSE